MEAGRSTSSTDQLWAFIGTQTGRDVTDAFIAAGTPPWFVGGTGMLAKAGGATCFAGGAVTLFVAPNAIASSE